MDSRESQTTKDQKASLESQLAALTAELQRKNRELEIETALENVRTRTTAMRSSSELAETSAILFQQLENLHIKAIRTGVGIFDEPNNAMELWVTGYSDSQEVMKVLDYFSLFVHPVFENIIPARQQKKPFALTVLSGNEVKQYYQIMSTHLAAPLQYNEREYYYSFFFLQGTINVVTGEALRDDECNVMIRVASAFGLIYTRFLDLQKAETQAREAQIEVAVERVRTKALAMHKSEEILGVVIAMQNELKGLDISGVVAATIYLAKDNGRIRTWDFTTINDASDDFQLRMDFDFRLEETDPDLWINRIWNATEKYSIIEQDEHDFVRMARFLENFNKDAADDITRLLALHEIKHSWHPTVQLEHGKLNVDFIEPPPAEMESILPKMGVAFDLAYTRFLDLQKAEAQTREAQIEAALERVRARSMAMHESSDLQEVIKVVADQFNYLEIKFDTVSFVKVLDEGSWDIWVSTNMQPYPAKVTIPYFSNRIFDELNEGRRSGKTFYTGIYSFEEKNEFFRYFFEKTIARHIPEERKQYVLNGKAYAISVYATKNISLNLSNYDGIPFTETENEILKRFALVFEQVYTRFLDLQKAEAQAREAKIEAALERVRSKALAMHKSEDLAAAVTTVFEEFDKLNAAPLRCGIGIVDQQKRSVKVWSTVREEKGMVAQVSGDESMDIHPLLKGAFDACMKQTDFAYVLEGDDLARYYNTQRSDNFKLPASQLVLSPSRVQRQYYYLATFRAGGLFAFSDSEFTDESKRIMKRFANVFDLTYNRFLDLQKAEAQTRESQIELGLERVRARAMAMQSSDELKELIGTVFTEITRLDIMLTRCLIMIYDPNTNGSTWWMANSEAPTEPIGLWIQYHELPPYKAYVQAWEQRELKYTYVLEGDIKHEWDDFLFSKTELSQLPGFVIEGMKAPGKVYLNASFNTFGNLTLATLEPLTEAHFDIMLRFAKVFDLTYTRFNDLQRAEAQAREAKIEASLERVRSKAMSMHSSQDLADTIGAFYHELETFSITPRRCGVGLLEKDTRMAELSTMNTTSEGKSIEIIGRLKMAGHPVLDGVFDNWLLQKEYHPVLKGNEIKEYYQLIRPQIQFPDYPNDLVQYGYFFYFPEGGVYAWTDKQLGEEELKIYRRFTSVLSLTYKRYKDLKEAESQAHKANIEVALERVRARALAMQQPEELKYVAEVLRQEMGLLGVEELETCSIFINDDAAGKTECWYALKDLKGSSKKLVNDHFILDLNDTWVGKKMLQFYHSPDKQTSIVMKGVNRQEWIKYCEEKSAPFRGYYGEIIPDRTYHLYKFSHGAIGAAAAGDISSESWDLLQRTSSVFSLAYSRFKDLTQSRIDLQRLKEEKQRAETALSELQTTQKQLIQSEKMASLGELTAGIAHEIQNPLNFVNNFSEVSNELLDEMLEEVKKGNYEDVEAIVSNVKQNLEKINHHGRRADGIVKGMLQHSRSSSGQKELTDINALCDEYLRLSYHGLRAKDKSFNAKFDTAFDDNISKVNIIPQDIGRVILNLINNAFYAVSERKKINTKPLSNDPGGGAYEPTVLVSTRGLPDRIEIRVKDNGTGIPARVLEKVFQPFFTTKPTGQGTGLGLSLSYDIVTKGHGGELKVETNEGEGTEFIVQLPFN